MGGPGSCGSEILAVGLKFLLRFTKIANLAVCLREGLREFNLTEKVIDDKLEYCSTEKVSFSV